jgi:glucose/arabinose dehydrogenase
LWILALAGLFAAAPACAPATDPPLPTVPNGFTIETIAHIDGARELAALPNGDLLVGTLRNAVQIVPNAEGSPAPPSVFATIDDERPAGVAFSAQRNEIYVGSTGGIWVIPYRAGMREAHDVRRIANVRTGSVAPNSDGDVHYTTSVAFDDATGTLYASVGSSCNACTEVDATRASILQMHPDGTNLVKRATRIRNGIALFIDPSSGALWVGNAGQDSLPYGHPYEFLDDVSSHAGVANYGWPACEENHRAYRAGADCSKTVAPLVVIPAYSTIVGATFYPAGETGAYAFPRAYRGGIFAAAHGSWHRAPQGGYASPPQVVFIPMNGDKPKRAVDWDDPTTQWKTFAGGFQNGLERTGRPTGVAVGPKGSLFVADDAAGVVYRIRVTH